VKPTKHYALITLVVSAENRNDLDTKVRKIKNILKNYPIATIEYTRDYEWNGEVIKK